MTNTPTANDTQSKPIKLGFVGFGEAASAFAAGWSEDGIGFEGHGYDIKTDGPDAELKWQDYAEAGVNGHATMAEAVGAVPIVFSLVTADQANAAAHSAAEHLKPGSVFFDCNSCAPDTKRASAEIIEAAGAKYVDTAVMAPVHPKLHKTPLLVSGPHAEQAVQSLGELGMSANIVPGNVGRASAIKMMRSVMIKGLEALVLECLLAARKAGVDSEVIASLDASFPGWDWAKRASYNMERTTTHGIRRAAEMREVAKTVADLGLMNGMSRSIVEWQQAMGELGLLPDNAAFDVRADRILNALDELEEKT